MGMRPPGGHGQDVVAGFGLRFGRDRQEVLVALRGNEVDRYFDPLLGRPFVDDRGGRRIGTGHPVVPQAERQLARGMGAAHMRRGQRHRRQCGRARHEAAARPSLPLCRSLSLYSLPLHRLDPPSLACAEGPAHGRVRPLIVVNDERVSVAASAVHDPVRLGRRRSVNDKFRRPPRCQTGARRSFILFAVAKGLISVPRMLEGAGARVRRQGAVGRVPDNIPFAVPSKSLRSRKI